MKVENSQADDSAKPEPSPPLGSWNRVYVAVLANLAVLILLFWLFSKAFS